MKRFVKHQSPIYMNRLIVTIAFAFVIVSCATKIPTVSGDGGSFETAVVAKSIASEYEWIRANYPGSKVVSQALVSHEKSNYDVLTTKLADGTTRKFYFNIDSFFGKGF